MSCVDDGVFSDGPVVSPSDDEEENEFYDCVTEGGGANSAGERPDENSFILSIPVVSSGSHRRSSSDSSEDDTDSVNTKQALFYTSSKQASVSGTEGEGDAFVGMFSFWPSHMRRERVPDKPNLPLSLWAIMKNCIGKDLSKIPMPVNFSEPLSMLQRLTEDYEYAEILDCAAKCKDPCEQLAHVAAFTVSAYSTTANRTGKPFNPLLGETYECDRRDDLGWRSISEQVSHHPPMVAQYCEGKAWRCWQEFTMTSKFRGKYLQVSNVSIDIRVNVGCTVTGYRSPCSPDVGVEPVCV